MRIYVATLLASIGLIFGINSSVDVSGMNSYEAIAALTRAQRPEQLVVSSELFDQRAWLATHLSLPDGCPEVLVLGSSTAGAIEPAFVGSEAMLNGWLGGPTVEDFEAVTAVLARVGCRPKRMLFSLDAWTVNANETNSRWKSLYDDYLEYRFGRGAHSSLLHLAATLSRAWDAFTERLSFEATRESVTRLWQSFRAHKTPDTKIELVATTAEAYCSKQPRPAYLRAYDGHYVRCPTWEPTPKEVDKLANTYVDRNVHGMRAFRRVDPDRLARLGKVVTLWRSWDADVVIYAPPYHPIVYRKLHAAPWIHASLVELDRELAKLASKTGSRFLSLRDPRAVPCEATEFADTHHAGPSCVRKVAARVSLH